MLGQICMDIAPQPDNRRNSEGALITCRDESILFVYSRFQGDGMLDYQAADLAAMRSRDDGRTFSASRVIVTHTQDQAENIMSVSLLRMQDGQIGLFYLVRHTLHCMRMFLRRSADEGETWSEKTLCTPEEGYFVVNNDRVVRLRDGTLLIPAAIHRKGYAQTPGDAGFFDMRSDAVFFRSRDDGKTWQKSANKCTMPYTAHCQSGLQEPGVIELASGVLWGWARTDLGRQYEMFSMDGGETWTCAQPSRFTSPNSPLSMKRLPDDALLAIWNPIPLYNGRNERPGGAWNGGRTPLVAAWSRDNGRTFSMPVALETEEESGYCYVAIHCLKDAVLLAYCAGSAQDGMCLTRQRIRRIPYAALYGAVQQ